MAFEKGVQRSEKVKSFIRNFQKKSEPSFEGYFKQRRMIGPGGTRTVYLDPNNAVDKTTIAALRTTNDMTRRGRAENVWGSTLAYYNQLGRPKPKIIYKIKGQG